MEESGWRRVGIQGLCLPKWLLIHAEDKLTNGVCGRVSAGKRGEE